MVEESSGASLMAVLSLAKVLRLSRVEEGTGFALDLTKSSMETAGVSGKSCREGSAGTGGESGETAREGWEMTVAGWEIVVTGFCMETTGGKPCGPELPPELKTLGLMSSGGLLASVTVT